MLKTDSGFCTPRSEHNVCKSDTMNQRNTTFITEAILKPKIEISNPELPVSNPRCSDSRKNKKKGKGGKKKFPQTADVTSELFVQKSTALQSFWDKESDRFFVEVGKVRIPFYEPLHEEEKQLARTYMETNDLNCTAMLQRFNTANSARMDL